MAADAPLDYDHEAFGGQVPIHRYEHRTLFLDMTQCLRTPPFLAWNNMCLGQKAQTVDPSIVSMMPISATPWTRFPATSSTILQHAVELWSLCVIPSVL